MRDESEELKKDVLKRDNMQSMKIQEKQREGGIYHQATIINLFSPIKTHGNLWASN